MEYLKINVHTSSIWLFHVTNDCFRFLFRFQYEQLSTLQICNRFRRWGVWGVLGMLWMLIIVCQHEGGLMIECFIFLVFWQRKWMCPYYLYGRSSHNFFKILCWFPNFLNDFKVLIFRVLFSSNVVKIILK